MEGPQPEPGASGSGEHACALETKKTSLWPLLFLPCPLKHSDLLLEMLGLQSAYTRFPFVNLKNKKKSEHFLAS